jgi:hypothetical protein
VAKSGSGALSRDQISEVVLYFFVNKNKTSADLLKYQQILKENKALGELEKPDCWERFVWVIITRNASPAVFDEFQDFNFVERQEDAASVLTSRVSTSKNRTWLSQVRKQNAAKSGSKPIDSGNKQPVPQKFFQFH